MKCDICLGEMPLVSGHQHFKCEACITFKFPTTLEKSADEVMSTGKSTDFLCPNCPDQNLHVGTIGNVQVCYCNNCRGFVIDRASLGDLIEMLRAGYEGKDDPPIMVDQSQIHKTCHCPACLEMMETFHYCGPGNVVIDSCNICKLTWMNHGELGQIIRAPGQREYRSSQPFIAIPRPGLHGSGSTLPADDLGMWIAGELF